MRNRILLAALLIVGTVFLRGDGCIMKDKPVDLIAYIEINKEYPEDRTQADFNDPKDIVFDVEVDQEIKDAGYSRDQVTGAKFVVGYYGALSNSSLHDWIVSGTVSVARKDQGGAATTAIAYTSQSVDAAVGKKIKAPVESAAVDIINQAIADYLAGQNGVTLTFALNNDTAVGPGGEQVSPADPMVFVWKAWIELYVKVTEEFEWPDPF